MYVSLESIINLAELDPVVVDGKRYWTAALYIVKQKPDYNQMIKLIQDGSRFYFVFDNHTLSGKFLWDI